MFLSHYCCEIDWFGWMLEIILKNYVPFEHENQAGVIDLNRTKQATWMETRLIVKIYWKFTDVHRSL